AEDGIRDGHVTGVQTCALPILRDTTGAFFAGSAVDMVRTDTAHWTAPYYERMGRRYAQAILRQLGSTAFGANGPKISSASRTTRSEERRVGKEDRSWWWQ